MKKLLLASTVMVMSAGVAAAEVTLSGTGRMGLVYDGDDVRFNSRARVIFTLSGETDTGLAFGGTFRADNAGNANRGTAGEVFISGDFGRLSMGDVDGAALKATGDLFFGSLTGLGDLNEMVYLSRAIGDDENPLNLFFNDLVLGAFDNLPRALYEFTIDDFSFFASVDSPDTIRRIDDEPTSRLRNIALGASYTFEGFTGGVGVEDLRISNVRFVDEDEVSTFSNFTARHFTASAMYEFDGFAVKAIAGRVTGDLGTALGDTEGLRRNQFGLSVRGTFDDITVTAFGNRNFINTNYGIGAAYNLGGGAAITGGIVRTGSFDIPALGDDGVSASSNTVADFGLTFRF
ncbi:MAG: porin [Roseinatronobacter sp.]